MGFIYPKYVLPCEKYVSNKDGSISFINVFENRLLQNIPTEFSFFLAISLEYSLLRRENREISVEIIDPEGNKWSRTVDSSQGIITKLRATKKNEINNIVNIIKIRNLVIEYEGIHTILLYNGEEIIGKCDIYFSKEADSNDE